MEVRMQPRSDGDRSAVFSFQLDVDPSAAIMQYRDFAGNTVHHFDIAGRHTQVKVTAESASSTCKPWKLPAKRRQATGRNSMPCWRPTIIGKCCCRASSYALVRGCSGTVAQLGCERTRSIRSNCSRNNDRGALRHFRLRAQQHAKWTLPSTMRCETHQGVCQDFAHIFLALLRDLRIPCRYVSGYMFHRDEEGRRKTDRSKAHRTLGLKPWCRGSDGWHSTQPIIWSAATGIFASRSAATMPTSRPRAACTRATPRAGSASR
jgi:hypothetical protein